jgi:alkylation response protein AidB-like acyl-CoA dehydrogenase
MSAERTAAAWMTGESRPDGPAPRIDIAPIIERVRPTILESEEALEDRTIPEKLVDELYDSGVLRALLPHELGGLEMHPVDWLDLTFELSRINGSVGWLAMICTGGTMLLPLEVMQAMASKNRILNAGSAGRFGSAVKVDGGYRFTGHWNFASGSPFADYLSAAAYLVDEDDEPILQDGQPTLLEGYLDVTEPDVQRFTNWDGLGLRGTGSNDFAATDHFVPDERVGIIGQFAQPFAGRPLYAYFLQQMGHASQALGVARGAIDTYIQLANRPTQRASQRIAKFGKRQYDKISVGEADALVRAAQAFAWDATQKMYDAAYAGEEPDPGHYVILNEANIFAVRAAKQAVGLVFDRAGVDGVHRRRGLERHYRDAATAAQHVANIEEAYEGVGHFLITGEPETGHFVDVTVGEKSVLAEI